MWNVHDCKLVKLSYRQAQKIQEIVNSPEVTSTINLDASMGTPYMPFEAYQRLRSSSGLEEIPPYTTEEEGEKAKTFECRDRTRQLLQCGTFNENPEIFGLFG